MPCSIQMLSVLFSLTVLHDQLPRLVDSNDEIIHSISTLDSRLILIENASVVVVDYCLNFECAKWALDSHCLDIEDVLKII